jgi:hypothetical protein
MLNREGGASDPMSTIRDGYWMLTIRKGKAYVPTMAKTEAGFYMGMEPIEVVDIEDRQEVENAVIRAITRGNPLVPTPLRDNYPPSPLLKAANVSSLSTFEKSAQTWKLSKHKGAYEIVPYKHVKPTGALEDTERTELVPDSEPLPIVVHRLVERALGSR